MRVAEAPVEIKRPANVAAPAANTTTAFQRTMSRPPRMPGAAACRRGFAEVVRRAADGF